MQFKYSDEPIYINEAVSTSYKLSACESDLKRRFVSVKEVYSTWRKSLFYKNEQANLGDFKIELTDLSELEEICDTIENSYGWFPQSLVIDGHAFIDWDKTFNFIDDTEKYIDDWLDEYEETHIIRKIYLYVEAKFTVIDNNYTELYHLTSESHLEKIKQQGLIPKSKGNFPERIYFAKSLYEIKDLMLDRYEDPLLMKLDTENYLDEIKRKYKFYIDPRLISWALYTYDSIDPKYIMIYENNEWKHIK